MSILQIYLKTKLKQSYPIWDLFVGNLYIYIYIYLYIYIYVCIYVCVCVFSTYERCLIEEKKEDRGVLGFTYMEYDIKFCQRERYIKHSISILSFFY